MAPPLKADQEALLKKLYYDEKILFGRDKLWRYIVSNNPESKISRRQTLDWLKKQTNYQLNVRPPTRKDTKATGTTTTGYISIDLIDTGGIGKDKGNTFILTTIDNFTRFADAIPLRNKSASVVLKAMMKAIDRSYEKVSVIQSDNGVEFNLLKDYCASKGIKYLTSKPHTPQTNGTIERFNGTIKHMIAQLGNKLWVKELPRLIDNYNNSYHTSIKTTPALVIDNAEEVAKTVIAKKNKNPNTTRLREFVKGDKCRVALIKGAFDKRGSNTYTTEIYTVDKVYKSKKPFILDSYKLRDSDGDLTNGRYNASQLQFIQGIPQ
jgi:transposase InsO family protein